MATLGVASTIAQVDAGTIDGAVIGGKTPAAGTFANLTSTGASKIGGAATDTLGFFGTTPAAQRTAATQATLGAVTATVASGVYGFNSTTAFTAMLAQLEEIRATLAAHGLFKGS
jgi:lipid-binding SYLF domain-containing protein